MMVETVINSPKQSMSNKQQLCGKHCIIPPSSGTSNHKSIKLLCKIQYALQQKKQHGSGLACSKPQITEQHKTLYYTQSTYLQPTILTFNQQYNVTEVDLAGRIPKTCGGIVLRVM